MAGRSPEGRGLHTKARNSLTGSNTMLELTAALPSWSDIPRRKYSSMSSSNLFDAEDFGTAYVIIPADNVTKFARTAKDFNYCKVGSYTLMSLTADIENMLDFYKAAGGPDVDLTNLSQIKAFVKWLDNPEGIGRSGADDLNNFKRTISGSGFKSFEEFIFDGLSPDNLGVEEYVSFANLLNRVKGGDEIWFEGAYLAIRMDYEYFDEARRIQLVKRVISEILS